MTYLSSHSAMVQALKGTSLDDYYAEKVCTFFSKFAGQTHKLSHFEKQFAEFEQDFFKGLPMMRMVMNKNHPNRMLAAIWVLESK